MSFCSGSEDAENHVSSKTCFYCYKEFDNYRSLGFHLRIHQDNPSLRGSNFPSRPTDSVDIYRNPHVSLPNSLQNSAGANNPIPIAQAPPQFDYSSMLRLNEAGQVGRNRTTGGNYRVLQTQNAVASSSNSSALRAFVPADASAASSSAVYAPFGSFVTTGLASDSWSFIGSNGIYQFDTDEFQISQDGLSPTSRDALEISQGLSPFSGTEYVGQSERSLSSGEGSESSSVFGNLVNAEEYPRISPDVDVELEDLLPGEAPIVNFFEPTSASETGVGAEEEEGAADLDLSLHL